MGSCAPVVSQLVGRLCSDYYFFIVAACRDGVVGHLQSGVRKGAPGTGEALAKSCAKVITHLTRLYAARASTGVFVALPMRCFPQFPHAAFWPFLGFPGYKHFYMTYAASR